MSERKKKFNDGPGKLFRAALQAAKKETLESLHARTGLSISWLRKFRAGEIKNPSVNRIEKVLPGAVTVAPPLAPRL